MALRSTRRARAARRRKRRLARLVHDLTDAERAALRSAWAACAYCGETGEPLQRDCVLPISRGGRYTIDNVVPACRSCNTSKCGTKSPAGFGGSGWTSEPSCCATSRYEPSSRCISRLHRRRQRRRGGPGGPGFAIEVDDLPVLAAPVEEATNRIVAESLTNAVRHAGARTCCVRLERAGGDLCVAIQDDGVGIPEPRADGVGLESMRKRASAIGVSSASSLPHRLARSSPRGCPWGHHDAARDRGRRPSDVPVRADRRPRPVRRNRRDCLSR